MNQQLNDEDHYILNSVRIWIWSGFYSSVEVDSMIDDILDKNAHEELIRDAVEPEFEKKHAAEQLWPETTDCDRLNAAFEVLDKRGVLCLQNAGFTMSDGHQDASEILSEDPKHKYFGYCFYHGQDLARAVDGGGLMVAFDHIDGDVPDKIKVALFLKEELERAGLALEWDGSTDKRINIPSIDWKRRYNSGR